jgi:hypothetical protein
MARGAMPARSGVTRVWLGFLLLSGERMHGQLRGYCLIERRSNPVCCAEEERRRE